jgi:twitching motility protein PilT
MEIKDLLLLCIKEQASDLHVTENEPPVLRIDGKLTRTDFLPIDKHELKKMIYGVMTNSQKEMFERDLELDFSLALPSLDRFRVNIHLQKGSVEGAFRRVPLEIPKIE